MRVTLNSTTRLVELEVNGVRVPARIWEGVTSKGTPVMCFITRVAPLIPEPIPQKVAHEFGEELYAAHCEPSAQVRTLAPRFVL